ncbi:MAG: CPBP family glutamic-type intramembrane protease [Phycicoccus sp.]
MLPDVGVEAIGTAAASAALQTTVFLCVAVPIALGVLVTQRHRPNTVLGWTAVGASGWFLNSLALSVPEISALQDSKALQYNWDGKVLAVATSLVLILRWRHADRGVDLGLGLRLRRGTWRPWLVLLVITVVLVVVVAIVEPKLTEDALYQATLPGLDEEVFYRGILLAVLGLGLGANRRLAAIPVGWAFAVVAVMFVAVHVVVVTDDLGIDASELNPGTVLYFGIYAFAFGWIRLWTGSLWPAVIYHNIGNTLNTIAELGGTGTLVVTSIAQLGLLVLLPALGLADRRRRRRTSH